MNNQQIGIFGEVLFDQFPDGQQVLGGAPFNVAWHLQAFGLHRVLSVASVMMFRLIISDRQWICGA